MTMMTKKFWISLCVLSVLAGAAPAGAAPARAKTARFPAAPRAEAVPGQVVVKYRDGVDSAERAQVRAAAGARKVRALRRRGVELVKVTGSVARAVEELEASGDVVYAEPNYIRRISAVPNDPRYSGMWGLNNTGAQVAGATADADIDAPEAWDIETGDASVIVAVVDTGVAYDHPDLAANTWSNAAEAAGAAGVDDDANGYIDDVRGWDFLDGDADPRDYNGHGTHVAGTIAAAGNNGQGIAGVAWEAKIMALRILDGNGAGSIADLSDVYSYASENGAKVVNGSFGGGGSSLTERDAIAAAPNTLFVFAAGNENNNNDANATYPCNYGAQYGMSNVMCVAASTAADARASFSNYGLNSVDLAAPGVNIDSTQPARGTPLFSDTFEAGVAQWTFAGTSSPWGTVVAGGSNALTDSPAGNYGNNASTFARNTTAISLLGQEGCRLSFDIAYDTEENYDGVLIEAATSSSASEWTALDALTGSSGGSFGSAQHSLEAFDGASSVFVRFRLLSDESDTDDGVYIDDVVVDCLSGTYAGTEFELESGTSMAAPHVAGVAALLFAQNTLPGGTTPARVRSAIIVNAEQQSPFASNTVSGARLNAARALQLVVPLDVTAPSAPAISGFTMPFHTAGTAIPLRWSASDGTGSGVSLYLVRYRRARYNGTFGSYVTWRTTKSTAGTFSAAPGYTYCFWVRARDRAGNYSAATERCTSIPVNDRSLAGSGWSRSSGSGYFLNTVSVTSTSARTLRLTGIRYKRLALIATKCSGCGSVQIYQGSTRIKSISLSATSTRRRQVITILTRSSLSPAVTITIRVSTSGRPVRIEGLGINGYA